MPLFESFDLWSIGGLVVGIIGIILTIVLYFKGKHRKILEYKMLSTNLITKDMANIPGISISHNGQPLANLVSTTIKFTNVGNQPILSEDFAALEPLGISTIGHFFNVNQEIFIDTDNSISSIKIIDKKNNRQYMQIGLDYLKPKQSISITLLHDGRLTISGDLKTGKMVHGETLEDIPEIILLKTNATTGFISIFWGQILMACVLDGEISALFIILTIILFILEILNLKFVPIICKRW